jgi:uncharacterized membrane protein
MLDNFAERGALSPAAYMIHQPFFIPSLLISLIALPLVLGFIPRNRWYGIRTAQTLSDETTWYRCNRFGGWAFLLSGMIYYAVARMIPAPQPPASDFALWGLHLCAFLLPLVASVVVTLRYVKGLTKHL